MAEPSRPDAPAQAAPDGRLQRSERSREAIVSALLALVGEGDLEPTSERVAERAGVGLRTVFRHFSDMESLFAAMNARIEAEARPLLGAGTPTGSLSERARALVRRRAALYEQIAPYKRSGDLRRPRSRFLREQHANTVRELRADLAACLPELRSAPPDLVDALELCTSFEAWNRLRSDQGLGRARCQATLERIALALVADLEDERQEAR